MTASKDQMKPPSELFSMCTPSMVLWTQGGAFDSLVAPWAGVMLGRQHSSRPSTRRMKQGSALSHCPKAQRLQLLRFTLTLRVYMSQLKTFGFRCTTSSIICTFLLISFHLTTLTPPRSPPHTANLAHSSPSGLPLDNASLCAGSDEEWHAAFQTLEKYAMGTGLTTTTNEHPNPDHKRLPRLPPIESAQSIHTLPTHSLQMPTQLSNPIDHHTGSKLDASLRLS